MLLTYSFVVFAVMLAAVSAAGYWVFMRAPESSSALSSAKKSGTHVGPNAPGWAATLARLSDTFSSGPTGGAGLRRRLVAAGIRWEGAEAAYQGICIAFPVTLVLGASLLMLLSGSSMSALLSVAPLLGYIGYVAPERYVRRRTRKRREAINRSLPDFLDLLVIAIESGLSMDQAVVDTARDLRRAHPVLADELFLFNSETLAGATRADALRNLGERSGEPELRKLCQMLIQADRFGSSVAKVLRTQARYMRIRRRQGAEEKAHKTSVKLLFPIFFLIMPSVFLVTAGPAVILLLENFTKMAAQ